MDWVTRSLYAVFVLEVGKQDCYNLLCSNHDAI